MTSISESIATSSIFFGYIYININSLKEINKICMNPKVDFFAFMLNFSIFTGSALYIMEATTRLESIIKK